MPTTAKKTSTEKHPDGAIVSDKVKSYANDPYFVKKANEASQTLKRVGLPEQKSM